MRRFPVNTVAVPTALEDEHIRVGLATISQLITGEIASVETLVVGIDGMPGVDWQAVVDDIVTVLPAGVRVRVLRTEDALCTPEELEARFAVYYTDNPVFGRVCGEPLTSYFDSAKFDSLVDAVIEAKTSRDGGLVLVVGPGALLPQIRTHINEALYWDLTREETIRRYHAGLKNLGDSAERGKAEKYKRALYVEWPILERHKRDVIGLVDFYVDGSREQPRIVSRQLLEAMIAGVARRPFRCKPYFEPGVWGGQRLKEAANLPNSFTNVAWDFEIVAPENAILIGVENNSEYLEIPFTMVMWSQTSAILGLQGEKDFGTFFPIRINYLDTIEGSDLSVQVHPHDIYVRENFNELIAQHESYYVVESTPGAKVYLGFQNTTTRENFTEVVRRAQDYAEPFVASDYVNVWNAHVGDYFMIPAGTVHCSGKGNLVLEISCTTYWYTFKLYDYLRPGMDGKPRPINSAYGLDVLDFSRNTEWVNQHLIGDPVLVRSEKGGDEYTLGTNYLVFYAVNRLHLSTEFHDDTKGSPHILVLTKGNSVSIVSERDSEIRAEIGYLETYVVPGELGGYKLTSNDGSECHVIKVHMKR